jgi:serine/threonine protein phosphatase PrpC
MDEEQVFRSAPMDTEPMETEEEKAAPMEHKRVPLGTHTIRGAKPNNEDEVYAWHSPNNKVIFGGVWDGHGGANGKDASIEARRTFVSYFSGETGLACETWNQSQWEAGLREVFARAHDNIRNELVSKDGGRSVKDGIVRVTVSGDPVHGGTTATLVVCILPTPACNNITIISANCGDSTALYVPLEAGFVFDKTFGDNYTLSEVTF